MFDPQNLQAVEGVGGMWIDPKQRLAELNQLYSQYPGRRPGGSGPTGIKSGFLQGSKDWKDMLQEQQEYLRLSSGQRPDVRLGGDLGSTRTLDTATGENMALDVNPYEKSLGSRQQALAALRKAAGVR